LEHVFAIFKVLTLIILTVENNLLVMCDQMKWTIFNQTNTMIILTT
jgi:hypothetical protein